MVSCCTFQNIALPDVIFRDNLAVSPGKAHCVNVLNNSFGVVSKGNLGIYRYHLNGTVLRETCTPMGTKIRSFVDVILRSHNRIWSPLSQVLVNIQFFPGAEQRSNWTKDISRRVRTFRPDRFVEWNRD